LISDDFFPQEKLFVDISSMFTKYPDGRFRCLHGRVTAVNHTKRVVSINLSSGQEESIDYHALIIATGASTPSPALGLNNDVPQLRSSWAAIRKVLPTAKSIVVAGGGPAGVETAGELGEYLNGPPRWLSSRPNPPKVDIKIVTSTTNILPVLRSEIAQTAEKYLAKVGVTVIRNVRVKKAEPSIPGEDKNDQIAVPTTVTLDNGQVLETDLYIPATGTTPNTGFLEEMLLAPDGRVETNRSTLRVEKAGMRVYAIGDASSFSRPTVHSIFQAVPILCANIKRDLLLSHGATEAETGEDSIFKEDTREAQLVPIGKCKGVGAVMGYKLPSFLIWLIKGRYYFLWTTVKLWSGEQWTK
jgi:NADH dehydrogenase FAD-containing subunit